MYESPSKLKKTGKRTEFENSGRKADSGRKAIANPFLFSVGGENTDSSIYVVKGKKTYEH